MADADAAVIDTHPLLFHAAGGRALGKKAARMFDSCECRETILYVPAVVMWECALLARAGRVHLRRSVRTFFDDLFSNPAFQPLGITAEDVLVADEIRFNRDPFDGLVVAVARNASLPLITRDADISKSGVVRVIW